MKLLKENALLIALALLKFVLHYAFQHPDFELHRDEYLYYEMGQHLSWGYFSVPPAIAVQGFLANLMGGDEWAIRFFPYFEGALTLFFVGKITQKLGGNWFAQLLACSGLLVIPFTRINLLFQPNSLEVLLFTVVFYQIVLLIQTKNSNYLLWIGVLLGVCVLNKYTTFVFILSILIGFLLTPLRKMLLTKHFFLGIILAFFIVLPNLIWQLQHKIPFFEHIRLLNKYQLVNVSLPYFFKMQILICAACIFLWVAGLLAIFLWKPLESYKIVAIIFFAGILIIGFTHGKDYYTIGYFPALFAFGGAFYERKLANGWQKWLKIPLFIFPFYLTYLLLPVAYPAYSIQDEIRFAQKIKGLGILRWEDDKEHSLPQDYADMLGWKEMAEKTYTAFKSLTPQQQAETAIITGNYGQYCAVNYYNRGKGLPQAFCFNWDGVFFITPEMLKFKNVVSVDDDPDPNDAKHCGTYKKVAEVTNPYAREKGTAIIIATDLDSAVHQQINDEYHNYRKLFFDK